MESGKVFVVEESGCGRPDARKARWEEPLARGCRELVGLNRGTYLGTGNLIDGLVPYEIREGELPHTPCNVRHRLPHVVVRKDVFRQVPASADAKMRVGEKRESSGKLLRIFGRDLSVDGPTA